MGGHFGTDLDGTVMVYGEEVTSGTGSETTAPSEGEDPECCIAGTSILTSLGLVNIENIKVGDKVYALHEEIAEDNSFHKFNHDYYEVTHIHKSKRPRSVVEIITESGKTLTCTLSHPIRVCDGTNPIKGKATYYTANSGLDVGMSVYVSGLSPEDRYLDKIVQINYPIEKVFVYSMTVDKAHTFISNGIVSHNMGLGTYFTKSDEGTVMTPTFGDVSTYGTSDYGDPVPDDPQDYEFLFGPSVTWVSSPSDDPESVSTKWTDTDYNDVPEGDTTFVDLKVPDSTIVSDLAAEHNALSILAMSQDRPEIIGIFDLYATELEQTEVFTAPEDGAPYYNAGNMLYSNGPSKLLRMQIMSGIFARANMNSLMAAFKVSDAHSVDLYAATETDWLKIAPSFYTLLAYAAAMRNEASQMFMASLHQTQRNMYMRLGLQMVKSIQGRSLQYPPHSEGSTTATGGRLRDSTAVSSRPNTFNAVTTELRRYRAGTNAPYQIAPSGYPGAPDTDVEFSDTLKTRIPLDIEALFEELQLQTRYKELSETAVFVQLVQELRRCILDGTSKMTDGKTAYNDRSIDDTGSPFRIKDDLSDSRTEDFFTNLRDADTWIRSTDSRWGTTKIRSTDASSVVGSSSGALAIGGIIPRGEDGAVGSITKTQLDFRMYSRDLMDELLLTIPQAYDMSIYGNDLERIIYISHALNRDFIISRRWRLPNSAGTGPNSEGPCAAAQRFNPTISRSTTIEDALDQVLGDSVGDIRNNTRDPDSYAAILGPAYRDTVDSSESVTDGLRLLPFEVKGGSIDGGTAFVSGYNAYINDLADSFVMRTNADTLLQSRTLKTWAESFKDKTDDLANFVHNMLMIGNVSGDTSMSGIASHNDHIISNHMLLRQVCLSISKFIYNTNIVSERLNKSDGVMGLVDGKYAVAAGYAPRRYEQLIQLSIIECCGRLTDNEPDDGPFNSEGFQRLEAYMRYRREALQIRTDFDGTGPKWPDFGDFKDDPGVTGATNSYTGGMTGAGAAYNFGGGQLNSGRIVEGRGEAGAEYADPLIAGADRLDEDDVATAYRVTVDDPTYWWEDYYAAFAYAYPRFAQAAVNLCHYYAEQQEDASYSFSTNQCVSYRMTIKSRGQSTTRYGLLQSPIGAALIQATGEKQVTGGGDENISIFDYLLDIWDDYEKTIWDQAKNINNHGTGDFEDETSFAGGMGESDYVQNKNTWYRNISRDTCRMMTYYMAAKLIKTYLPVRGTISFEGGVSRSDFTVQLVDDTGNIGAYDEGFGAHARFGDPEDSSWRFYNQDGYNTSIDSPFVMNSKFQWDPTRAVSFLMACIDAFGISFAGDVSADLESVTPANSVYGSGNFHSFVKTLAKRWGNDAFGTAYSGSGRVELPSTHSLYKEVNASTTNTANFANPSKRSQAFEGIPAMVMALSKEDTTILAILNTFRHVSDILNNQLYLGQGLQTSEPVRDESYLEYLRRYVFGNSADSDGTSSLTEGSIDLDDESSATELSHIKTIFDSLTPDAVATSYAILCDNFTLSSAYISATNNAPTPMQGIYDASFSGNPGKYAHLIPASEAVNEINYALIRWFQSGAKNVRPPTFSDERGGQTKKILTVGLPLGLLENLRDQARKDEFVYRSKAFKTSNFVRSSLIRIRVMKKSHDNPNVVYTPRNFYFDTRLFFTNAGFPLSPPSLNNYAYTETDADVSMNQDQRVGEISASNLGQQLCGVYNFHSPGSDLSSVPPEIRAIRNESTMPKGPTDDLTTRLNTFAVQFDAESASTAMGHIMSNLGQIRGLMDSNYKLITIRIGTGIGAAEEGRHSTYDSADYDVEAFGLSNASNFIKKYYGDAINGSSSAPSTEDDPTVDFFGTNDSGDSGETIHGIAGDPWVYDQLTGEYYTEAMSTISSDKDRKFAAQVAANEFYSGILKNYIKMSSGFDVSERSFLVKNTFGDLSVASPVPLSTGIAKAWMEKYRPKEYFGNTDLFSDTIPVDGSSMSGMEATIGASRATVLARVKQYVATANPAVSDLELRAVQNMFLRSLPISAGKFRDQGLLPRVFDRTFCIAIDAENDFTAYNSYEEDTLFDAFSGTAAELVGDTTFTSSDGMVYSFVVDVGIVPMDQTESTFLGAAKEEELVRLT